MPIVITMALAKAGVTVLAAVAATLLNLATAGFEASAKFMPSCEALSMARHAVKYFIPAVNAFMRPGFHGYSGVATPQNSAVVVVFSHEPAERVADLRSRKMSRLVRHPVEHKTRECLF